MITCSHSVKEYFLLDPQLESTCATLFADKIPVNFWKFRVVFLLAQTAWENNFLKCLCCKICVVLCSVLFCGGLPEAAHISLSLESRSQPVLPPPIKASWTTSAWTSHWLTKSRAIHKGAGCWAEIWRACWKKVLQLRNLLFFQAFKCAVRVRCSQVLQVLNMKYFVKW